MPNPDHRIQRRSLLQYAAAAVALSHAGRALAFNGFIDGRMYALECLGHLHTGFKWLDGRTHEGVAGLAPKLDFPFTGTKWKAHVRGALVLFECQGHLPGPRWLDGQTMNGRVTLAPEPGTLTGKWSGTLWKPRAVSTAGATIFECQGNIPGVRFLDGDTVAKRVLLRNEWNPFSGTRWRIHDYPHGA